MINKIEIKSILNKHKRRDDWFLDDYSINPYSGCSFNCIYCYTRGSKYGGNISKTISIKVNASEVLEKQLSRRAKKGEYGIISLASATEPYMPIEKELQMTRKLLKIILKYKFPVEITTKSDMVLRDLDILKEIDKIAILPDDLKKKLNHGVIISFSISTLDKSLSKILEPGAPSPLIRLETMKKCKEKDFFTGVSLIPVLPYLSDSEEHIEKVVKIAKEYKADFIFIGGLTLFCNEANDCKTRYYKFLEKYYPSLLPKYRKLYKIFWAPSQEYQKELENKAKRLCNKYKIKNRII